MGRTSPATIEKESIINGDISPNAGIAPSKLGLTQRTIALPLADARVWDSLQFLPSSSSSDDLALLVGTPGTNFPKISTQDAKTLTISRKCAFLCSVPSHYIAGGPLQVIVNAAMNTTAADVSATVDCQCYCSDGEGGIVSPGDLCQTSAGDMNTTSPTEHVFDINASNIEPGAQLQIVLTLAVTDSATATAVIAEIHRAQLIATCRG